MSRDSQYITVDGNQAAARIAHWLNEVIAIYPITPASPMGEWADDWSAQGQTNLLGSIPRIVEMQSEGGAAGAIHGALQAGALTTSFTASQGLLLMIPNMYKIAGELSPLVIHVAARSVACQALSIFGDHSDVMATRATGFGMLCASSVQAVQDFALISQVASLKGRIPMLHFFDGFRSSHEIQKIIALEEQQARSLLPMDAIQAHRSRAMSPDHPVLRGSSQNPDIYFQARETVNPYYDAFADIMQQCMDDFAATTGRQYKLFEYYGHDQPEHITVIMGSGAETVIETVDYLLQQGSKIGMIKVNLYRPFASKAFMSCLPASTKAVAVLDRTKEPGADGEPLYKDVLTCLAQHWSKLHQQTMPTVIGGRYGLSSKEFTPAMICAVYDELASTTPKQSFTIGIHDDISHTSLAWDKNLNTGAYKNHIQALFYGLGSDGTVSANKNSIKIIGEETDNYAQGYFVYDSKKSGAVTISHLRFGPSPIQGSYLIGDNEANFIACHQPVFLERYPMLDKAADNAVFLLNSSADADSVWDSLPNKMQQQIIGKNIQLYFIDAYAVANKTGMGKRINTIMQTCFFAISGILPREQAVKAIKDAVSKTYGRKGRRLIEFNYHAIDETLTSLQQIKTPTQTNTDWDISSTIPATAPKFIQQVTGKIIAGHGDDVPVSALPADGSFPLGTAAYEKRNLALEIPVWDAELCSQCGKCPLVCPHGVIRCKVFPQSYLDKAPASFKAVMTKGKDFPQGYYMSYQVAPEDCTGCGLCVEICPIHDKSNQRHKALNMESQPPLREAERDNWNFFLGLPEYDRSAIKNTTIRGAMILQPLFEFSGACEGCGETPYIKLATQLFGERMLVANATGCSSIYGGNLPTTPWTKNNDGRGPAWNNSLFEDNAEFGLGMRLAADSQHRYALTLLQELQADLKNIQTDNLFDSNKPQSEAGLQQQRSQLNKLKQALEQIDDPRARELESVADSLIHRSVWIIGGDGWAYDIGYGGLDHVLASGEDVNILVLDTEVYSNTGGQTSKATPRGAVAKFSAAGKAGGKKDLALLAMGYEHVYIAHVAYGAKDVQTLRAFVEADAHIGPSLIIAYSPCIAHGVDLANNHRQQDMAVRSGHWPLFRFNPNLIEQGKNPLHIDSKEPDIPYREYIESETRFSMLWRTHPEQAETYLQQAQQEVLHRYQHLKQLSELDWSAEKNMRMNFIGALQQAEHKP